LISPVSEVFPFNPDANEKFVQYAYIHVLSLKCSIFWDISLCSALRLQSSGSKKDNSMKICLLHAGFLLSLFFEPEEEGDTFPRTAG
jgi:hypothetical protein